MPFDLQTLQIAIPIVVGVLTILGTIFGWLSFLFKFKSKPDEGIIKVPIKPLILIPVSRQNALCWHMGSVASQPAMQIVGDLNVTNISNYGIFVMGAKLRKPKAVGHASFREHTSDMYGTDYVIPKGAVSDLRFDFFIQPPVRARKAIQSR